MRLIYKIMPPKKDTSKRDTSKKPSTNKKSKTPINSSLEPYCGIEIPPPKGKRIGTMEECVRRNQVRRYGLRKVDESLLGLKEVEKVKNANKKLIQNIDADLIGAKARVRYLNRELAEEQEKVKKIRDEKRIKELKQQIEKAERNVVRIRHRLQIAKQAKKEREQEKQPTKITQKEIDKQVKDENKKTQTKTSNTSSKTNSKTRTKSQSSSGKNKTNKKK